MPSVNRSLIFSILWIELFFEFPFELVISVNAIRPSSDIARFATTPNKSNILKGQTNITHLVGVNLDVHCPKVGFESLKEVIYLPCPMEDKRPWCIPTWSGGYLDGSTIGHCDRAHLEFGFKGLNPCLVRIKLDLDLLSLEFAITGGL